uniref:Nuclear pore complex protein NUP96 C-terminal domain-containing protein n=1 Tax=Hippocampus comes TaxID=109280 RepID=A0A3Q3DVN6_HIPCM
MLLAGKPVGGRPALSADARLATRRRADGTGDGGASRCLLSSSFGFASGSPLGGGHLNALHNQKRFGRCEQSFGSGARAELNIGQYKSLVSAQVWQTSESVVNACSQLDWKRCVAVHLWFMLPPTASVADALAEYCRQHYGLQQLLEPLSVTWERLDFRLSWHLWGVLQALHYSHLSAARQGLLHASYAAQLESAGLWHLAVFILLHIPDHTYRERAVRAVLSLHCPLQETEESLSRERFLTRRLLVPERWIHEAKSVRARHCGDKHREALHLYRAGCWSRCHRLLVAHLAPDCIINGNHDYLLEFLEGLAVPEHSATIQDWDTAGKVYLDYIRITNTLRAVQQVGWSPGLERLHTQVTSLCDRIQLLPCEGARDRLAQSGSKTVWVSFFFFLPRRISTLFWCHCPSLQM